MKLILNILITAVVVYVLSKLLAPHVAINSVTTAIIFAIVLGILNFIVKPLLILLTIPLTLITLGLFLLVINVIIIMLADKLISGIKIDGFLWTCIFAALLSVVSTLLNKLEKKWSL